MHTNLVSTPKSYRYQCGIDTKVVSIPESRKHPAPEGVRGEQKSQVFMYFGVQVPPCFDRAVPLPDGALADVRYVGRHTNVLSMPIDTCTGPHRTPFFDPTVPLCHGPLRGHHGGVDTGQLVVQ